MIRAVLILILLSCSGCAADLPALDKAEATVAGGEWTIFRGDPNLTGVAASELPAQLGRVWTFKTGSELTASPVVGDGRVYIGSLDGTVYALTLETGELVWQHETESSFEAPALLLDGAVIIGSLDGELLSLDAVTGALQWTYTADGKITGTANWLAAPAAADGEETGGKRLFIGAHDSKLHCVDATTGKGIWSFKAKSFINGGPAIDSGSVVFGGCDHLVHRLSAVDGSVLAAVEVGSYAAGSPAVVGGQAYVGTYDGYLVAVDLDKKRVLWEYDNEDGGAFFSSPAIAGEWLVAGGRDLSVHCVERATGKRRWVFRTQGDVDSSPVIVGQRVVFGSTDGRLYMVSLDQGELLWSYEIGSALIGTPAVAGGKLIIGAEDGRVYAFGKAVPSPTPVVR